MKKGTFGYLQRKRTISGLKSVLLLSVVLAVFFGAKAYYGTEKTVFSILAAVGALPAGRSIVVTIMCLRAKGASEKARQAIEAVLSGGSARSVGAVPSGGTKAGNGNPEEDPGRPKERGSTGSSPADRDPHPLEGACGYDLCLTSYERTFCLSHAAAGKGRVIALAEDPSTDCALCERHIAGMLSRDGLDGYRVEIYSNLEEYAGALSELAAPEGSRDHDESGTKAVNNQETREADRGVMRLLYAVSL